ncbi:MAG: ribonuclease [Blastocatellia bacterium]|jgi:ribonuclease G|nr:ribonuclease [Blastocatellia bacterium]
MSRELIVSVNGKEKKIAIVENDRVTEFYIERGEQNQGIVGNIYKGRVMRVLPGMQSAFVDIGLERDAFLYVTDFFDEEAEFERIVVDKSKKVDPETATRAATERIEQSRVEREHHIEGAQERAEPLRDAPLVEVEAEAPSAIETTEEAEEGGPRRRGRRGGRGRSRSTRSDAPEERRVVPIPAEPIDTPFVNAESSFQRISDDEERAMNGEMFKDARLQERLMDEVHAAEFDMEDLPSVSVGSLLSDATSAETGSFQRIADDDDSSVAPLQRARELEAARVRNFVDEIAEESSRSLSFERVSDDEAPDSEPPTATKTPDDSAVTEPVNVEPAVAEKRPARRTAAAKETTARKKKPSVIGRLFKSKKVEDDLTDNESQAETAAEIVPPDSEASITTGRVHEEFATRRGGRRRRRPSSKRPQGAEGEGANDADGADGANGLAEEVEPADLPLEAKPDNIIEERPSPAEEPVTAAEEKDAPEVATRTERRPPAPRGGRGGGRRPARHERAPQPAITDLLKEGQEILVQIAKEPIAKKGARITSHIALPGRFLVYMPTVEHLGVSRKIESDSERTRLRKLIQKIHVEEKQPAGGFIVRTAGVGASEADLHADAKYLLRTWHDLRQDAEKAKAPALVHKDLDLVQRILRDQLSEDFTAIRIDTEDEYQSVVEFVNRMQPRLVKRVKLYTRDEPILEAYGVQAEIDKAIKPRVWLRSGGYLVINQTEALVSIDVNTGKFVGRGATRLEDTITRTNMEAVEEIARQIRLRDLGGIIVLDLIDMEERRNRQRVMTQLQDALRYDKSPTKVLSFNDFGLVIMTRKRVKQSLERTLCTPCLYCQGAGLVKSPQTICYEILEQARRLGREGESGKRQAMLRINPEVAKALRGPEREVLNEIEDYLGSVDINSDPRILQEQFDFAFV